MKSLYMTILLATIVAVPVAQAAGDVQAGKSKSEVCAACHGPDGNSPSGQYPDLAGQGAPYLFKQLQDFQSGARDNDIMRSMTANLSEQDMRDLAAYYAAQQPNTGQANPKWAEMGRRLFRGGDPDKGIPACSGCHGPAGQGVDAARFPALAGQHAEYVEAELRAFRAVGRGDLGDHLVTRDNDPAGMMRAIAARLSDKQIRAVASFVSGLSLEQADD